MASTDTELYAKLRENLAEVGHVTTDPQTGGMVLTDFPQQQVTPVRLLLTAELVGRAVRALAPDYADQFPLLAPDEAALVALFVHVLAAVEAARPGEADLTLDSLAEGAEP